VIAPGAHPGAIGGHWAGGGRWADRYAYADDAEVEAIGSAAGQRRWYTKAELLIVARWKTRGRSVPRCEMNSPAAVRKTTRTALATNGERERVDALVELHGVQLPTASVLLHLARPKLFPIIDFRALWSLGLDEAPVYYGFGFWWAYTLKCRELAASAGVSMRRLDRALWQYSKENQPARGSVPARPGPNVRGVPTFSAFPVETYLTVVAAAIEQHTIPYSALPGSRRVWGRDLYRIAEYEQAQKRPPLTVIVVRKQDGRPGEGGTIVAAQAGYKAKPGESADDLWERALADVFAYWKP
jgi:hypothetical protein